MSLSSFSPAIVLFGDSITEALTAGSIWQRLAEHYNRRLDVVNRGFAGYNSDWAIPALKRVLATKDAREAGKAQPVKLITIWLGANDAALPGTLQHVPLDRFKSNISKLVSLIRDPSSEYYNPDTKVLLINVSPIIPDKWLAAVSERAVARGDPKPTQLDRSLEHTKLYSDAVLGVAAEDKVPVVDIYAALVKAGGGEGAEHLDRFLYDGLHFSPEGYAVLFDEVINKIAEEFPGIQVDSLDPVLPMWGDVANGAKI